MGNNYTQYEIEELWKDFIENVNHMKDTLAEKDETEIKHYILYNFLEHLLFYPSLL